jgi:energy-converting hydrogenase A subunit M
MTKKTAIALLGAVMLASAAYAIGSQSGGGNADAKSRSMTLAQPAQFRAHFQRAFGFGDLASKLGVSGAQLQQALMDVSKDLKQAHEDDFAQALADALGMPVDKVKAALAKQHAALPGGPPLPAPPPMAGRPGPPLSGGDPLAGSLAQALGVDEAKVRDALQKLAPEMKDIFATRLAALLGVDKAKVEDALKNARPLRAPRFKRFMRVRPLDLSNLAKDLGVSEDQLKQALMKARQTQAANEAKRRDAFAEALAKRLNLDVQKVKDALGSMPGPHMFGHP